MMLIVKILKTMIELLRNIIHYFKPNSNAHMRGQGYLNRNTKCQIRGELVVQTFKGLEPQKSIKIKFWDGSARTYTPSSWGEKGADILKKKVILKLDEV